MSDFGKDEDISPCPSCGGEVEWSNSRCLNILESKIQCSNCDLSFFHVEDVVLSSFEELPNLDYETTLLKYNAWCATNPKYYGEHKW